MAVREVAKKGGVLVGFHERASSYVADLHECPVMPQRIAGLLLPLRALFGALTIRRRLPQVELALGAGDDLVLVLRVLDPPTAADRAQLAEFGRRHRVRLWLQPLGPDSAEPLTADDAGPLLLDLDEFGLRLPFLPTDFTQVNHCINEVLVRTVVRMLTAPPGGVTIDFFCGLGNFTLPIAAGGARVLGFEGSRALVERARAAAAFNRLEHRARFAVRDLSRWTAADWPETVDQCAAMFRQQPDGPEPGSAQHQVPSPGSQLATGEPRLGLGCSTIERVLLDPPREGAPALARCLAVATAPPRRLVYVSCNPSTLARDCAVLVHEGGWQLRAAGVVNMFPQTSHVESIALLEPPAAAQ
jgi:23S rRNA (uracil1939-C5)-methyltransferase